jgi:hypothetical protein
MTDIDYDKDEGSEPVLTMLARPRLPRGARSGCSDIRPRARTETVAGGEGGS